MGSTRRQSSHMAVPRCSLSLLLLRNLPLAIRPFPTFERSQLPAKHFLRTSKFFRWLFSLPRRETYLLSLSTISLVQLLRTAAPRVLRSCVSVRTSFYSLPGPVWIVASLHVCVEQLFLCEQIDFLLF